MNDNEKKALVQRMLDAEGPQQTALGELRTSLGNARGALLMDGVRAFGDQLLDQIRGLNGLHKYKIPIKHIATGLTPEKVGLDPSLVLAEHRGDEAVVVDPLHTSPLRY